MQKILSANTAKEVEKGFTKETPPINIFSGLSGANPLRKQQKDIVEL